MLDHRQSRVVTPSSVTRQTTPREKDCLSQGNNETGTLTFTLYLGSTLVDTETVQLSS